MSAVRRLNWFESEYDAKNIMANGWNLQVAKAVASNTNTPSYNLVWQSRSLAPITSISWKAEYGLAWTAQVPSQGVQIRITGKWQACNRGESFDINSMGYWQPSSRPVDPEDASWLNVGNIDYSYPGVLGIHIVVGVRNADTGRFEPIFIDKAALGRGSSGRYQPQETISWWLEGSDQTGQVFTNTKGRSISQDFSNPSDPLTGAFEWSTSFITASSNWVISPGAAPQMHAAPPPSELNAPWSLGGEPPKPLQLDDARWTVTFAKPLTHAGLASAASALYSQLKDKFNKVEITIEGTSGDKVGISYEAGNGGAPGTVAFLGDSPGASGDPVDTIDQALRELQGRGDIPRDQAWVISPTTLPSSLSLDGPISYGQGSFGQTCSNGV